MNFKYLYKVIFLFLATSISTFAQKGEKRIEKEFPVKEAFPSEYFGEYSGNLRMVNGGGVLSNIPMEFVFSPTEQEGVYIYELIYIRKNGREVQKFTITTVNKEKGAYFINGNDNLKFPASMVDGILYSTLIINDNIMTSEFEFNKNGKIYFTVTKSSKFKVDEEKNKDQKEAYAYFVVLLQKAFFVKNEID